MTDQKQEQNLQSEKQMVDLKTGERWTWQELQKLMEQRLSAEVVEAHHEQVRPRTGDPDTAVIDLAAGDEVTWREMERRVEHRSANVPEMGDIGKPVVNADGKKLGSVAKVESGKLYMEPHSSIVDQLKARFGWDDPKMAYFPEPVETFPVPIHLIDNITEDSVHLKEV